MIPCWLDALDKYFIYNKVGILYYNMRLYLNVTNIGSWYVLLHDLIARLGLLKC